MTDSDGDLFGIGLLEEDVEDAPKRVKQPYKTATIRPPTKLEAVAGNGSLFGDDAEMWNKTPLDELYVGQQDILDGKGRNGLKMVGLFDGAGGSMTGFTWSGWQDLASVEFVQAARETLQSNYPVSIMINPDLVLASGLVVAERMGLPVLDSKSDDKDTKAVILYGDRKVRKKDIVATLNWEETLLRLGGQLANDFRTAVNEHLFAQFMNTGKTIIWGDDIRGLDANVLMKAQGIERGELDCLEGSPPCKSFSTSGLREQGWGKVLHYSDERDQRTDDLFMEFLRILDSFRPRSFVAENVAGLGMGAAELEVMAPLMEAFDDLGYSVSAKVLNAKEYDVPQSRPRMIFQGIRKDQVSKETGEQSHPRWPVMSGSVYTTQNALDAAAPLNKPEDVLVSWLGTKGDLKKSLTSNFDLTDEQADALIATKWPKTIKASSVDRSLAGQEGGNDDIPWPEDQPRYETGRIWYTLNQGGSPENKAYQLIRCHSDLPSPTITATSAGNQPAAGPTHPHECRKFTIPEYRALFSFPHDYTFTGTVDQQGERMGRSVPPYLMKQIADSVATILQNSESNGDTSYVLD